MEDTRRYPFEGTSPKIHDDARVSRESTLIGRVTVGPDVTIWPGVVVRADIGSVAIGARTQIGDNATIHASTIGEEVLVGHGAVLNEAVVEDGSLIGFNATINTGVTVGTGSIVAAGAVLPERLEIPPHSFVRGVPATITPLSETTIDVDAVFETYSTGDYVDLARRHGSLFD